MKINTTGNPFLSLAFLTLTFVLFFSYEETKVIMVNEEFMFSLRRNFFWLFWLRFERVTKSVDRFCLEDNEEAQELGTDLLRRWSSPDFSSSVIIRIFQRFFF